MSLQTKYFGVGRLDGSYHAGARDSCLLGRSSEILCIAPTQSRCICCRCSCSEKSSENKAKLYHVHESDKRHNAPVHVHCGLSSVDQLTKPPQKWRKQLLQELRSIFETHVVSSVRFRPSPRMLSAAVELLLSLWAACTAPAVNDEWFTFVQMCSLR